MSIKSNFSLFIHECRLWRGYALYECLLAIGCTCVGVGLLRELGRLTARADDTAVTYKPLQRWRLRLHIVSAVQQTITANQLFTENKAQLTQKQCTSTSINQILPKTRFPGQHFVARLGWNPELWTAKLGPKKLETPFYRVIHNIFRHIDPFRRINLSLIHIWRCRRSTLCRSRWSPYH